MFDVHITPTRLLVIGVALLASGCAPDAMNNRAATPFNAFVNQISRACAPIQLGRYQLADPLMGGVGGNSYDFWLDQTSRLFYRRISPAGYRESLNAFFGAGNDGTIDCILANLPPA
jgi:hypothetical protein